MTDERCPHIGLPNHPEFAIVFPEELNCCHKADPVESISLDHQGRFCFAGKYAQCPVYKRTSAGPLPARIQAGSLDSKTRRMLISGGVIASVIILGVILIFSWWKGGGRDSLAAFGQNFRSTSQADATLSAKLTNSALIPTATATDTPPTVTPTPEIVSCPIPEGWVPYVIAEGDTFDTLAARLASDVYELQEGNCLEGVSLTPGMVIFVPDVPTMTPTLDPAEAATLTAAACPIPEDWALYIVQKGDSLRLLSRLTGVSEDDLIEGNCLESTKLAIGQQLYLPAVQVTPTPSSTATYAPRPTRTTAPSDTPAPTKRPTRTRPPSTATPAPTSAPTLPPPSPTNTLLPPPTVTSPPPTPTDAPPPTPIPIPSATPAG